jgi:hypothetical protein
VKPQHLQELAAKEQQDGADRAAAADAQAQKQRQQPASRQSAGGGPAVVEQMLQLNNELFMTPEALFRYGFVSQHVKVLLSSVPHCFGHVILSWAGRCFYDGLQQISQ